MTLQISLLPEFGWSIRGQPVYGPGSVFQGFVKLNLTVEQLQSAERLRLVFHATESTYSAGFLTPTYSNQLFGSQKILWRRKDSQTSGMIVAGTEVSLPFIIQLPMVQFPPSANIISKDEGLSYHTNFILTAYLDQTHGESILKSSKSIVYMPFIETKFSKKPIMITNTENIASLSDVSVSPLQQQLTPSVNTRINTLDYIPGDTISVSLSFNHILKKSIDSISIKLYQIQTWNKSNPTNKSKGNKCEKKLKHLVAQNSTTCHNEGSSNEFSQNEYIQYPLDISLDIPIDTLPTFTYGPIFSTIYQLKITIKRKAKLWTSNGQIDLTDLPITIGTLGYGIKSSEEIKVYSVFKSVFNTDTQQESSNNTSNINTSSSEANSSNTISNSALPVPKFLDAIEYEEALPIYIDDKLPTYDSVIHRPYTNCIM